MGNAINMLDWKNSNEFIKACNSYAYINSRQKGYEEIDQDKIVFKKSKIEEYNFYYKGNLICDIRKTNWGKGWYCESMENCAEKQEKS